MEEKALKGWERYEEEEDGETGQPFPDQDKAKAQPNIFSI